MGEESIIAPPRSKKVRSTGCNAVAAAVFGGTLNVSQVREIIAAAVVISGALFVFGRGAVVQLIAPFALAGFLVVSSVTAARDMSRASRAERATGECDRRRPRVAAGERRRSLRRQMLRAVVAAGVGRERADVELQRVCAVRDRASACGCSTVGDSRDGMLIVSCLAFAVAVAARRRKRAA